MSVSILSLKSVDLHTLIYDVDGMVIWIMYSSQVDPSLHCKHKNILISAQIVINVLIGSG